MLQQPDNLPDDQIEVWQQAVEYFNRAFRLQVQGDFAGAMHDYRVSLRLFPTAEAHTLLAWNYANLMLYEQAVAECRKAIEVDPDFGNPYSDLGTYLIELGRVEEAVGWLEKATVARRCEMRAAAFYTLGRAHELLGHWQEAIAAYRQAERIDRNYQPAPAAWQRLVGKMN